MPNVAEARRLAMNEIRRAAIGIGVRRFAWVSLIVYAFLTLGLWISHLGVLGTIGGVTNYTIEVSLLVAITFGGLFAAVMALRPFRSTSEASVSKT